MIILTALIFAYTALQIIFTTTIFLPLLIVTIIVIGKFFKFSEERIDIEWED